MIHVVIFDTNDDSFLQITIQELLTSSKYDCVLGTYLFILGSKKRHTNHQINIMVIQEVVNDRGPKGKFQASLGKFWASLGKCLASFGHILKMVKMYKNG